MLQKGIQLATSVREEIENASRRQRSLRRGKYELIRDFCLLISGLKPAVLLDYTSATPELVLGLFQKFFKDALAEEEDVFIVAELNGSCLVLNLTLLKAKLDSQDMRARFIMFESGSTRTCRWATADEDKMILNEIGSLVNWLQNQVSSGLQSTVINLDGKGGPLQPTLQGWLLGYPVVYYVTEENIEMVSKFLSSIQLTRLTLQCDPKAIEEILGKSVSGNLNILSACTLPTELQNPKEESDSILHWKKECLHHAKPFAQQIFTNISVVSQQVQARIIL